MSLAAELTRGLWGVSAVLGSGQVLRSASQVPHSWPAQLCHSLAAAAPTHAEWQPTALLCSKLLAYFVPADLAH
jgi:hypothetical protein